MPAPLCSPCCPSFQETQLTGKQKKPRISCGALYSSGYELCGDFLVDLDGRATFRSVEDDALVGKVIHNYRISILKLTLKDLDRKRAFNVLLKRTMKGPRSKGRIVPFLC